jgi:hypothetical protein
MPVQQLNISGNDPGQSPVGATLNDGVVSFFTSETTAPNSTNLNLSIAHGPEVEVKIYSISVVALIDSGASISEKLFISLQQKVPEGFNVCRYYQ